MNDPESVLENETLQGFWYTNGSPNLGQTTRPNNNQQKKKTCKILDFAAPANHMVKLKESEKRDTYPDLTRELKKLWNMNVTIILTIIGALGKVTKGLVLGQGDLEIMGWVETVHTAALLWLARILRRVLETWGDLLSLKLHWKTVCQNEKLWRWE